MTHEMPDGTKVEDCGGHWASGHNSYMWGDLNGYAPWFMDYWTIFYWGWWISWCPFVGMFIAKISRGRSIAQIIEGTFFVAISYVLFWMAICGGAGIRMERMAEQALGIKIDANGVFEKVDV